MPELGPDIVSGESADENYYAGSTRELLRRFSFQSTSTSNFDPRDFIFSSEYPAAAGQKQTATSPRTYGAF